MTVLDEGELDIRFEAFCDYVDSLVERSGEGGYQFNTSDELIRAVGGNFVFGRQYLLPEHLEYHQLTREGLITVARYLSDAIISPKAAISTTLDHFRYWAWTAAVASRAFEDREEEEKEALSLLRGDFQNTVHLGLVPLRINTAFDNPTIGAIHSDSERLTLISGLSVLEGFICHLGDSLTPEGRLRRTVQASWKPERDDGSMRTMGNGAEVSSYHDILQIWLNYEAKKDARDVLIEINDISRYDDEMLEWKFEDAIDVIERERRDGTDNFLTILEKHRNLNLHGQRSTHALAPLALTLCCLYIWDAITDEAYDELSGDVLDSVRWGRQTAATTGIIHPLWPSAFYPI